MAAVDQGVLERRKAMLDAGWVYAHEDLPGVYVPGPELACRTSSRSWAVTEGELDAWLDRISEDDPKIRELLQC